MNITVSKVESSAGTVQAAQTMGSGKRREEAIVESLVRGAASKPSVFYSILLI
jgi:hypothetical protein